MTSSALIVLGVGAAYLYSAFAVIERGPHVYFDTATMVLMLFTVGRYLEAAGRARAARDLEPLLAAESECATVVDGNVETRRPVREVGAGIAGAGAAGGAHSRRWHGDRRRVPRRRGCDHRREPPRYQKASAPRSSPAASIWTARS